jgi:DNA repair photolyase
MQTIYQPKGKAFEYASLALNLYESCPHGCRYCYAASMALRFGRAKSKDEWHGKTPTARIGILAALDRFIEKARDRGVCGENVLMCFSCDPYPLDDPGALTRQAIMAVASGGYTPIILTKGGTRACRDFDVLKAAGGWFGQTCSWSLLSPSPRRDDSYWEPYAAPIADRWDAFHTAKLSGIPTWLSVEPVLSVSQARAVLIEWAAGGLDHFKLGKLSGYDSVTREIEKSIDWPAYREDARQILNGAGYIEITEPGVFEKKSFYVKAELREAK